jgi:hypothetical protein
MPISPNGDAIFGPTPEPMRTPIDVQHECNQPASGWGKHHLPCHQRGIVHVFRVPASWCQPVSGLELRQSFILDLSSCAGPRANLAFAPDLKYDARSWRQTHQGTSTAT